MMRISATGLKTKLLRSASRMWPLPGMLAYRRVCSASSALASYGAFPIAPMQWCAPVECDLSVLTTLRQRLNRSRGFTLLEMLVVLVVVGVMVALLVIGFKDSPQQRVRREANDLAALINAASDEAVMRGIELGLVIDGSGYQFVYFDPEKEQWQPAPERGLARHDFAEPYTVDFTIDGSAVDDNTRRRIQAFAQRSGDAALRPLLLILSSGEVTPFRLVLSIDKAQPAALTSDGLNPVVVVRPPAENAPAQTADAQS